MADIEQMLDDYRFSALPAKGRKKIVEYVKGLEARVAELEVNRQWIKLPGEPPNYEDWSIVAWQGSYYWVYKPPVDKTIEGEWIEGDPPNDATVTKVKRVTSRPSLIGATQRKAKK